ncbi:MAG: hypothetical protein ABFR47_07270 [Verrucomicrobiota bacterium]
MKARRLFSTVLYLFLALGLLCACAVYAGAKGPANHFSLFDEEFESQLEESFEEESFDDSKHRCIFLPASGDEPFVVGLRKTNVLLPVSFSIILPSGWIMPLRI